MKRYCIVRYDRAGGDVTRSRPMTLGECLAGVQNAGFREAARRVYESERHFCKIREVEQ